MPAHDPTLRPAGLQPSVAVARPAADRPGASCPLPSSAGGAAAIDEPAAIIGADAPCLATFRRPRRAVDRFFVVGFNRRSAGDQFESIKQAQIDRIGQRPDPMALLRRLRGVSHGVILATCCRVEFHGLLADDFDPGSDGAPASAALIEDFLSIFGFDREHHPMLDLRQGSAAVEHVLWICLGGDSVIPGETEIVGQLKQAYRAAQVAGVLHGATILHRVYQRIFFLCKKLRRIHLPGSSRSLSLPKLVLGELQGALALRDDEAGEARRSVDGRNEPATPAAGMGWRELRIAIVGAGEMGLAFARHLGWRGVAAERITFFVHRPDEARQRPGFPPAAHALSLEELPRLLRTGTFDALLGAAGAGSLLGGDLGWVPRNRPLLIVDVSVPPLLDEAAQARLPAGRAHYVGFSRLADRQSASSEAAMGALRDIRDLVRDYADQLAADCDSRAAAPPIDLESVRPGLVARLRREIEREVSTLLADAYQAAHARAPHAPPAPDFLAGLPVAKLRDAAARVAESLYGEVRAAASPALPGSAPGQDFAGPAPHSSAPKDTFNDA